MGFAHYRNTASVLSWHLRKIHKTLPVSLALRTGPELRSHHWVELILNISKIHPPKKVVNSKPNYRQWKIPPWPTADLAGLYKHKILCQKKTFESTASKTNRDTIFHKINLNVTRFVYDHRLFRHFQTSGLPVPLTQKSVEDRIVHEKTQRFYRSKLAKNNHFNRILLPTYSVQRSAHWIANVEDKCHSQFCTR